MELLRSDTIKVNEPITVNKQRKQMKRNVLRLLTMLPLLVLATFYTKAEQLRAINPSATAQQLDAVSASATEHQPDTLTVVPMQVQQYRVMTPFISDSLDVQGKAYDATDLLKPVNRHATHDRGCDHDLCGTSSHAELRAGDAADRDNGALCFSSGW